MFLFIVYIAIALPTTLTLVALPFSHYHLVAAEGCLSLFFSTSYLKLTIFMSFLKVSLAFWEIQSFFFL